MTEELLVKLTRRFVDDFDKTHADGDLGTCTELQWEFDKGIRELGYDPVELHEYIIEYEHVGESIQDAVVAYVASCSK
tara:strand:- start:110 stop:343 length:234 start_codon:yes stop_codon:yes gene_type:complete